MGSKSKTKSSSTQTPTVTEPYKTAFGDYTGMVGDFMDMDPQQFVAPPSSLQMQAFGDVGNLGGWQPYLTQAQGYATSAANAPASQVTATGYQAPNVPAANQFGGAQLGGAQGYNLPAMGSASRASSNGLLGDSARLNQFMADYQNPYGQQVIDATMADFDQYAGTQRAAMDAKGAYGGAFGGSRWGIAEGQLEGELSRGRASTLASLRDQQFRLGAELAGTDAAAANQFKLTNAGMGMQAALANQNADNQFKMTEYGAGVDQARYGADSLNQFAMQQGLLDQQTGQYNTDALNNFLMTQVGLDADSARYYADALNQSNFQNANLQEQEYARQLQASGQLGDLSQAQSGQSLADLGMTADMGSLQRSLEAEYLNAYPTQLQMAGNLYSQLSPALYSGVTSTGTNSTKSGGLGTWLPQVAGSAMQAGAVAYSDRRLKRNIVRIGEWDNRGDGLGRYTWDWVWGGSDEGVLADEVKQLRPQAYIENYRDDYAGVNYARLSEAANV